MLRLSSMGILVVAAATAWGAAPDDGAARKRPFTVEAIGALGVGETAYEISAAAIGSSIRSRLEFPLDGVYVGADGRYNIGNRFKGIQNLTIGLKFLTNSTDPSESMNDYDWVNGLLVGDTASDTEASSYIVDLYLKGDLVCDPQIIVRGVIGFRHEEYAFDIYGIEGFYLPPIGNGRVTLDNNTLALTYEMKHNWAYGGIEGQLIMTDSLRAGGGAVVGIGAISDRDDHVLRDKISKGEFVSVATKMDAHLIWYLARASAAYRPYVKAGIEALVMVADGEQDQRFEDSSTEFSGIDDKIEMTFVTAGAMVGCNF